MKRIYLESMLLLLACVFISITLYEFSVYQFTTDYEFVQEDDEGKAFRGLLGNISQKQGIENAIDAAHEFAVTSNSVLTELSKEQVPSVVVESLNSEQNQGIYYDEERDFWFTLPGSESYFVLTDDLDSLVRQKVDLEDNLAWVFLLSGFFIYGLSYLYIIFRRVAYLERITLKFAAGEMAVRANTAGGRALGTLNRSFNHMADKISELIVTNKSLTNAVAHELRTPIFRIQWQAEILKETQLDSYQTETVCSLVEDTEEMESMIDELLSYAKLDQGQYGLELENLDLVERLASMINKWQSETALHIEYELPAQKLELEFDTRLFDRALGNVVRNAIKHAKSQILIHVQSDEEVIRIQIHDDGSGVAEKHRPYIFNPFYVADESRSKQVAGYGLGLSIVEKICHQHGADIQVHSSERLQGALFEIVIPKFK